MLLAMSCPPSVMASNTSCRQKPRATPINDLLRRHHQSGDGKCLQLRRNDNQRRQDHGDGAGQHDADAHRHGLSREYRGPPSGTSPPRTNGHSTCPSQVSSCPVVSVIIRASPSLQLTRPGMLVNSSRV